MKKVRVGIFSFTCDEGCSIVFLEILNRKFFEWEDEMELRNCRVLRSKNEIKGLDIAFVEGAVSTFKEVKRLKEIRKNAKLVAIGSCAISGAPSNLRNFLSKEKKEEIKPILKKFGHKAKVSSVSELVKVDDSVSGCPMEEEKFVEVMEKYLKEFG